MYIDRLTAIFFVFALTSCGGRQKDGAHTSDIAVADTLVVDTVFVPSGLMPLPDTIFRSAECVRYSVEVADTTISPLIESLEDMYDAVPGAFTFRNGSFRQADFGGRVNATPSEIVVDWKFNTAVDNRETEYGIWGGGTGWTGQPLYVEWPDSCVERFRMTDSLTSDFGCKEIIVGSLDGNIYFINFDTGKSSRRPIQTANPIKGTVSLDPTLNGNLYAGQGIPAEKPFGAMVVNLYKHAVTHFTDEDPKALRGWGAYDSSPVRVDRFLLRPGENGTIYKYLVKPGTLKLQSALRYTVSGAASGIEASMSVYRNYGYVADNHGNILCVNLNTMRPVWRYSLDDDTDATPVIEIENGHPYLYVGCEIDRQPDGTARFVKLDALNGTAVWQSSIAGRGVDVEGKHFDGGYYATALPGRGNCRDLIFCNCVTNIDGRNGELVAFSRKNGAVVYRTKLKHYAWSSPVGFLNKDDELFVVTADTYGNVYLINGIDGKILFTRPVGHNFESSPVVVGNQMVVGSRGNTIFKMTVK